MKDAKNVGALILWRWRGAGAPRSRRALPGSTATPHEVADSLTVEGLPDKDTPARFKAAVTSFRHLRHDARIATIRRVMKASEQ